MKKEDIGLHCAMEEYQPSEAVMNGLRQASAAEPMTEEETQRILHMALRKIDDRQALQKKEQGVDESDGWSAKTACAPAAKKCRSVRRGSRRIGLIAACIAVLALSAVSFASTFLDGGLVDLLGGESRRSQEILSDMGTLLSESQSCGGYTVTLKQLIHDRSNCYVLMEVSRDDGQALEPGYHSFARSDVRLEEKTPPSGWYIDPGEGADGTSPSVTLLLQYEASEGIAGKTVNLSFQDFGRETWDPEELKGEFIPLVQAEWEFNIEMGSQDNTQEFAMNQTISAGDTEAKVIRLYLSPISLAMDLRGRLDWDSENELLVVLKDGTQINCAGGSYGSRGGLLAKSHMGFRFSQVIDPQQIDRIYYNGQELVF